MLLAAALGLLPAASSRRAPEESDVLRLVRWHEPQDTLDAAHPTGAAFPPGSGTLLVPGPQGVGGRLEPLGIDVPDVRLLGFRSLPQGRGAGEWILFDPDANELVVVDSRGHADRNGVAVYDPRGLAVDPRHGDVFLLDGEDRVVGIQRSAGAGGRGVRVTPLDLPEPVTGAGGLAYDAASGHLHVLDTGAGELHELDGEGTVVAERDLPGVAAGSLLAVAFAPTTDDTDSPGSRGLYALVRRGEGLVLGEWTFAPLHAGSFAATQELELVQTIDTSRFSPPSPDPAGLAYLASRGSLLVSDSEVNEMNLYRGVNVFESTRFGSLVDTFDTTQFSDEPTGAAWNPLTGHLFFSDDQADEIFELDPGSDGAFGTNDDRVTSFDTRDFGSSDPEGVGFDPGRRAILIVDGADNEVYQLTPGANGRFDGVPPRGDDQLSHFDTAGHGITDPEGIDFDSASGHVFVVGKPADVVAEFTVTGALVRLVGIAAADARKPAGIALGSGSQSGGWSLWVSDRNVDNGSDPNENDGRVYEFALGEGAPPPDPNDPPLVSAGPDLTVTIGETPLLEGSVEDDGKPDPPGETTSRWSQLSGPGLASFVDAGAPRTRVGFSEIGTYVLRLTASDGALQGSDEATVLVTGPNGERLLERRVAGGSDDAEERSRQRVVTNAGDLDLGFDARGSQIVGLRFDDLEIPRRAEIVEAWVRFTADEMATTSTSLVIAGQAADDAPPFARSRGDLSGRPLTGARVAWPDVPAWSTGASGAAQRTPDLSGLVQEIVDRPGWNAGHALVLLVTGSGQRVAESFEGDAGGAALLRVVYRP